MRAVLRLSCRCVRGLLRSYRRVALRTDAVAGQPQLALWGSWQSLHARSAANIRLRLNEP